MVQDLIFAAADALDTESCECFVRIDHNIVTRHEPMETV